MLILAANRSDATQATADVNTQAFEAICPAAAVASLTYTPAPTDLKDANIIDIIAAINLTANEQNVTSSAIESAGKAHADLKETDAVKKVCTPHTWDFCVRGAKFNAANGGNPTMLHWSKSRNFCRNMKRIARSSRGSGRTSRRNKKLNIQANSQAINEHLQKAPTGTSPAATTFTPVLRARSRVQACGDDGRAAQIIAGDSLMTDVMCLCGINNGDATTGKAACTGDQLTLGKELTQDNNVFDDWKILLERCKEIDTPRALTPERSTQP
uniref:Variant surface glycoprotein 1125.2984 n=1 Tax=Trypanosoma brucei TaxID=5691 RepID=A0A1J0R988_9TRYP|nr:variant surface glycoprotein 1125.2984 [Trypanosoma brucei]